VCSGEGEDEVERSSFGLPTLKIDGGQIAQRRSTGPRLQRQRFQGEKSFPVAALGEAAQSQIVKRLR